MPASRLRSIAALLAALVFAAGAAACGNDRESNPGQDPQSPGVDVGTNPAVEEDREEESGGGSPEDDTDTGLGDDLPDGDQGDEDTAG